MEGVVGLQRARAAAITALCEPDDEVAASLLRRASEEMASRIGEQDTRPTATAWRSYARALIAVAALREWKAAVRRAERDGSRHLDSAHLLATEAVEDVHASEPILGPITDVLGMIEAVAAQSDVGPCLDALRAIPLPLPLLSAHRQISSPSEEEATPSRVPIAVALFELDGEPAPDAALLQTQRLHDLGLQLRLTDWPLWADRLGATVLSIAGDSAQFPSFEFARPEEPDDCEMWSVDGSGVLVIKASRPLGSEPITGVLSLELTSTADGRRMALRIVGQPELRLWAMGESPGSFFTGYAQLDQRLAEIFTAIWSNRAYGPDEERSAFMRFLYNLLRVTTVMQKRNRFPLGVDIDEGQFQAALLESLELRDELAGRVQRGTEVGGGETDLVYENIVAELKVERRTPVTKTNVAKYLGQTTSYSSGLGSQLGIAVVLDLSPKLQPLGTPANYVHWLEPKLHGIADPKYPSRIAVLVVNGNVPLPSSFAGRTVEVSTNANTVSGDPGLPPD